jgi:hypothetical protein
VFSLDHLITDTCLNNGFLALLRIALMVPALFAIPPCLAQEDCFRGEVHSEPQTVADFLIRFLPATVSGVAACRVEVFSLQGGMAFHVEDAALKLVQPAGTDLNGDGVPDVALESYSGGAHCCWTYWIVSLGARPGLLASFKNQSPAIFLPGDYGKSDIQTRDGAFDYFDCLSHAESPLPNVFLRLEGRRLKDVGMDHLADYEKQIRDAHDDLSSEKLNQFRAAKSIDDLCSGEPRSTMPAVLTTVLAYLYSGQERHAWTALDEMWPKFDALRIRAEIVKARARGILTYTRPPPVYRKRQAGTRHSGLWKS